MPKPTRTAEQQAATAALVEAAANMKRLEAEQRAGFVAPRFTRKEVASALKAKEVTFQNWHARGQLDLDANEKRDGEQWRLFSARDVLRLGLAIKLSQIGLPASYLRGVMTQLDAVLSAPGPYMASNRPACICVTVDGQVFGPFIGGELDLADLPMTHFSVVRLDQLVRDALEPLGYSVTVGTAEDMRETIERLAGEDK